MKKSLFYILILIIIAAGLFAAVTRKQPVARVPAISATYANASTTDVVVSLPFPGAVTGKSFSVMGQARGPWYFEASFPVTVVDSSGKIIATGQGKAQGDWMTADFVPFKADISVPESFIGPATVIIKKDNPSGDPVHDASVSIPITIEY